MKRFSWIALALLCACVQLPTAEAPPEEEETLPVMRWDFRPESETWTAATLEALQAHGAMLPQIVPGDYSAWCPNYAEAELEDRAAFWSGLLSALAKHESTWNPRAVGGGGLWIGLTQIDPRTARGYGCEATSVEELKNGAANLRCAVRIAASQVAKRGTVNRGMLDWGPFHSPKKRAEMQAWTRAQPYCQPV